MYTKSLDWNKGFSHWKNNHLNVLELSLNSYSALYAVKGYIKTNALQSRCTWLTERVGTFSDCSRWTICSTLLAWTVLCDCPFKDERKKKKKTEFAQICLNWHKFCWKCLRWDESQFSCAVMFYLEAQLKSVSWCHQNCCKFTWPIFINVHSSIKLKHNSSCVKQHEQNPVSQ